MNGAPAVLRRVLGVLKGVDIPPGKSRVIFICRPVYYVAGMALLIIVPQTDLPVAEKPHARFDEGREGCSSCILYLTCYAGRK
jgi:hypothetical protein